jgi:hypothetical protein
VSVFVDFFWMLTLLQCKLGSTVGYAIRFEDCTSAETKIKCRCSRWTDCRALLTNV